MPSGLESLNFFGNDFHQNVEELANAFCGKKIKKLHLEWCKLTSQNAAIIIKSLADELESLDLSENGSLNNNAEDLANAFCGKKIKELNLRYCRLTPQNAVTIIKSLSELEILCLDENDLSEDGTAELLADALNGQKIKELELSCCKLLPQDSATIIKSLADELESLDLSCNDFPENVEDLVDALSCKKIKKLNLGCKLTSKDTKVKIIEKADVQTLILDCNFGEATPIIQALKQPGCKIEKCVLGDDDWNRRAQEAINKRVSNQTKLDDTEAFSAFSGCVLQ